MLRRSCLKLMLAAGVAIAVPTGMARAEMPATVDQPVTMNCYNYNLASASAGADATRELLRKFREPKPNAKVAGTPVPPSEVLSRVQADIVAGRQPDVA